MHFHFLHHRTAAPKISTFDLQEKLDVPGGKGECNLLQSCKECKRQGNISIDEKVIIYTLHPGKLASHIFIQVGYGTYTNEDSDYVTMITLDCRGWNVAEWVLRDGFVAKGTCDTVFYNVDLSDDFAEYDEETEESVSIMSASTRIA